MKGNTWALILAAGVLAVPAAISFAAPAPKPAARPSASRDWTHTVIATPEGGYRMGNPGAVVKLVEYGSLTCPHCAAFSREASAALIGTYVKSGRVSWEFRPFLIFPTDPGLTVMARCQGAASFFRLTAQFYAEQEAWIDKVRQLPEEELQRMQGLEMHDRIRALTKAGGLDSFFVKNGVPAAKVQQCLADDKAIDAVIDITRQASTFNVNSTPSFLINGKKAEDVHGWAALEPLLKPPA